MPKKRDYWDTPNPRDLPAPPAGSEKQRYYNEGDLVWYCRVGPNPGVMSNLEKVRDDETSEVHEVPVERIRLRLPY
ncbi:hypothetical protein N7509_000794 [Penicillium cosmopolitanum]|uniref:Uncharacterized protein n=1 Tax=Penicillium cosmopolitanum TaxID=1131564 RepID=A0A9X0BEE6_9EURO|nr:uncharacterized protein N7509_000794 [Penicillium cosmopolitanum]KAJ5414167.1 hypothetical protein N7509_000794 [Penicillium cosmopolitanum]